MKFKLAVSLCSLACALLPEMSQAKSVSDFLQDIYTSNTTLNNVTGPSAYQGQQAGYLSGGSLVARAASKQISPVHVTIPRVSAGCGGIDAYLGGISFIKADEFAEVLEQIAQGSAGYALEMALESLSPMMAQVTGRLKTAADTVNRFQIKSCEMSQLLVGAAAPRNKNAQQYACALAASKEGKIADFIRAKNNCSQSGKLESSLNRSSQDKQNEVLFNVNLVWATLKDNGVVKQDKSLAEWIMTISGTEIFTTSTGHDGHTFIESKFVSNSANMLKVLLEGGSISAYYCDDADKCLSPEIKDIVIKTGLKNKVKDTMAQISNKILNRSQLDESEQAFVNSVSLPVYKMIDLDTMGTDASGNIQGYIGAGQYADLIAIDWLTMQLNSLILDVKGHLNSMSFPDDTLIKLNNQMSDVIEILTRKRQDLMKEQNFNHLVEQMHLLEIHRKSQVAAEIARQLKIGE